MREIQTKAVSLTFDEAWGLMERLHRSAWEACIALEAGRPVRVWVPGWPGHPGEYIASEAELEAFFERQGGEGVF